VLIGFNFVKAYADCWELVLADEFNGTSLDTSKWNIEVNGNPPNAELEYYTDRPQNVSVGDTVLSLTAIKENYSGKSYTSGRINTQNKFSFKYGRIESRMKLPYGQGMWPAFWMLGNSISTVGWPNCGEIDIMEMVGGTVAGGGDNVTHATLHWGPVDSKGNHPNYGQLKTLTSGKFSDAFHTFGVTWSSTGLTADLDGSTFYTIAFNLTLNPGQQAFRTPFFPILNLAVGGSWPGSPNANTVFPQSMKVDYVRVYQSKKDVAIAGSPSAYPSDSALIYNVPFVSDWGYQWELPAGATAIGALDSNVVKVNWGCSDALISCIITGGTCVDDTVSMPVTIKQPKISGPDFFSTAPSGNVFSFPSLASSTYNWSVPAAASITSGQGTNSITVTWGTQTDSVKLDVTNVCGISNYIKLALKAGEYPYPDPFIRHAIPGSFNAVEYNYGGEGVAYHDAEAANQGPAAAPRHNEGVDTELGDNGNPDVGWIISGEWLNYSISVAETKTYAVNVRNGSGSTATSIGPIHLIVNGTERTTVPVGSTGAWNTFVDKIVNIDLTTADTLLRIEMGAGNFNISEISFFNDTIAPTETITTTPSGTVHNKFKVTVTFSEAVTGFSESDISVTNGTLSGDFAAVSALVYTDSIVPVAPGNVDINIAAGVCMDAVSNANLAATPLTVSYIPVAVNELSDTKSIDIYPNPINGVMNYKISNFSGIAEFSIFNVVGSLIYRDNFTVPSGTIDMSDIKSGTYILKVKTGNNVYIQKILVN
jgi:beta-glucanase (GH16 family)